MVPFFILRYFLNAAPSYLIALVALLLQCASSVAALPMLMVSGCDTPSISIQPVSDTTCVGGAASFELEAEGTGLSFQWYIDTLEFDDSGPELDFFNVNIWNITPIENISHIGSYFAFRSFRFTTSGATYPGVPHLTKRY